MPLASLRCRSARFDDERLNQKVKIATFKNRSGCTATARSPIKPLFGLIFINFVCVFLCGTPLPFTFFTQPRFLLLGTLGYESGKPLLLREGLDGSHNGYYSLSITMFNDVFSKTTSVYALWAIESIERAQKTPLFVHLFVSVMVPTCGRKQNKGAAKVALNLCQFLLVFIGAFSPTKPEDFNSKSDHFFSKWSIKTSHHLAIFQS